MMAAPGKRTLVVLLVLVGAMTLASELLLWVEPGNRRLGAQAPSLSVVAAPADLPKQLFDTTPAAELGRWDHIVVYFSGAGYGTVESLSNQQQVYGGLAYHLVIGNGQGLADGRLEVGFRWQQQLQGLSQWVLHNGNRSVDICLIGDGRTQAPTEAQMRTLTHVMWELQRRLNISDASVQIPRGTFPVATFREQLLSYSR